MHNIVHDDKKNHSCHNRKYEVSSPRRKRHRVQHRKRNGPGYTVAESDSGEHTCGRWDRESHMAMPQCRHRASSTVASAASKSRLRCLQTRHKQSGRTQRTVRKKQGCWTLETLQYPLHLAIEKAEEIALLKKEGTLMSRTSVQKEDSEVAGMKKEVELLRQNLQRKDTSLRQASITTPSSTLNL